MSKQPIQAAERRDGGGGTETEPWQRVDVEGSVRVEGTPTVDLLLMLDLVPSILRRSEGGRERGPQQRGARRFRENNPARSGRKLRVSPCKLPGHFVSCHFPWLSSERYELLWSP